MTAVVAVADVEYARTLTDRIKAAVEGTWHLITEAYTSRAYTALGYANWDDYCTREFGTSRLRLPREERSEVVGSLRDAGLSIRAIAAATGDSIGTVHQAIASGVQNRTPDLDGLAEFAPDADELVGILQDDDDDEPALTQEECEALDAALTDAEMAEQAEVVERQTITGIDGKTYTAPPPKAPGRKSLPDSFWRAAFDMGKGVERVARFLEDDRFKRNADQIAERNLNDLIRARDALQRVIDQLT